MYARIRAVLSLCTYVCVIFEVVLKMVECFLTALIHYVCGYILCCYFGYCPSLTAHNNIYLIHTFCFYFNAEFSVNLSVESKMVLNKKLSFFFSITPKLQRLCTNSKIWKIMILDFWRNKKLKYKVMKWIEI